MNVETTGITDVIIAAGSHSNLARQLGVTRQAVQQWVTRGYVPLSRIVEIESLYGIDRKRLLHPKHLTLTAPPHFELIKA